MGFQQLLPDGKMEQMTSSQQPPNNHDFVNFRLSIFFKILFKYNKEVNLFPLAIEHYTFFID